MIDTIVHLEPHIIYNDEPVMNKSGDIYYYAKDSDNYPLILVYDHVPNTKDEYQFPKAIRDASVIPAIIKIIKLIESIDESEMILMFTADMYDKVIAEEEPEYVSNMGKRLATLRTKMDLYHKWITYLEKKRKDGR